jgi:hypothetical protein
MSIVLVIVGLIAILIVLDVASLLWGVDSREGPNDPEWERRANWRGYR